MSSEPQSPDYHCRYVLVAKELIGQMVGEWSRPLRVSITSEKDNVLELVFRDERPFTHYDAKVLRDIAEDSPRSCAIDLRSIADRIEALLPPQPSENQFVSPVETTQ